MVVMAFNRSELYQLPFVFDLKWFAALPHNQKLLDAGMNTVLIAGRPIRSTCVRPVVVVAQTPIREEPDPVKSAEGSSSTIADTFFRAKKSVRGEVQPRNDLPLSDDRMLMNPSRSKKKSSGRKVRCDCLPHRRGER